MDESDKALGGCLFLVLLFVLILLGGYWIGRDIPDEPLRSDELITPQIELIIRDNKVDTIYIYKNGTERNNRGE